MTDPTPSPSLPVDELRGDEERPHPLWPDGSPILLGQLAEFDGGEAEEPGGTIIAGVVRIEPDEVTLWWDHEGGGRPYTAEAVLAPDLLTPAFPPAPPVPPTPAPEPDGLELEYRLDACNLSTDPEWFCTVRGYGDHPDGWGAVAALISDALHPPATPSAPAEQPQPDRAELIERLYDANGSDDITHHEAEVRGLLSEAADALADIDEATYLSGRAVLIDAVRHVLDSHDHRIDFGNQPPTDTPGAGA